MTRMREAELVWNAIMLPRHRVIIWLSYQDKLLTKERLLKLNILTDGNMNCCLCELGVPETELYLFSECEWVTTVREKLATWTGIAFPQKPSRSTLKWIRNKQRRQFRKEVGAVIYGDTIYYTWQARNWRIFRKLNVNREFIVLQIQKKLR
ncbi:PREDICTED: uncharacterized protein LOC109219873 [Nicotiana attenuata]|uniref:uncharacterized protein LOC109219873 n=1 Tax=Nicotiana attenuata TaxID=49451 RepID=UPI000905376A|nr:PREDICTED: uncharacterized protein LOC109219873 [Nicotiana attenuata]